MNILSINFPITLSPGVFVYDSFIKQYPGEDIFNMSLFNMPNIDPKTYYMLTLYLQFLIQEKYVKDIVILEDTKEINDLLLVDNINLISMDLYNHLEDWDIKKIQSYKWVSTPHARYGNKINYQFTDITTLELEDYKNLPIPDKIILVSSKELVHPLDRIFFNLWEQLIYEYVNYPQAKDLWA